MNNLKITLFESGRLLQEATVEPGTKLRMGRSEENELVLAHHNVSRYQCVIFFDGVQWVIEDLNSTNGFTVKDQRESYHELRRGDEISIVPFSLLVNEAPGSMDSDDDPEDATVASLPPQGGDSEDETAISTQPDSDRTEFLDGSEDMTYVDNRSAKYNIVIKGGGQAGSTISLHNTMIVGRDEACDLILDDPSISRKHLKITSSGNTASFQNLSSVNVTRLNNEICESGSLKHGDLLQIGDTKLKFQDTDHRDNFIATLLQNKKFRLGLGGFLILFCFLLLFLNLNESPEGDRVTGGGVENRDEVQKSSGPNPVTEAEGPAMLKKERTYNLYFADGEKLIAAESYQAAVARFTMCLEIKPGDPDAVKQLKNSKRLLEEQQQEEEEIRQDQQKAISTAQSLLESAGDLADAKDYESAIVLLDKALSYKNKPNADEDLLRQARVLKRKVVDAKNVLVSQKRQIEQDLNQQFEEVRRAFVAGNAAVMNGDFVTARKNWKFVAETKLDVEEKQQAANELEKLEVFLMDKSEGDYQRGVQAKKRKNYPEALTHLQKVMSIYPDHAQAGALFNELMAVQGQKARRAYQKGLVYEGINNMEKAIQNWKRAIRQLPLEESEYHIKAKEKLAEYSQ